MRDCENRLRVLDAFRADPSASIRELAAASGLGTTAVYHHLCVLDAEGVIRRNRQVGRPKGGGKRLPSSLKKSAGAKKAQAGRQGRGVNAFKPKKSKKDGGLEERIALVVKMAREREQADPGYDVVNHDPRRLRFRNAMKVG